MIQTFESTGSRLPFTECDGVDDSTIAARRDQIAEIGSKLEVNMSNPNCIDHNMPSPETLAGIYICVELFAGNRGLARIVFFDLGTLMTVTWRR